LKVIISPVIDVSLKSVDQTASNIDLYSSLPYGLQLVLHIT